MSVDPERDTVEALAQYVTSSDKRIVAFRPCSDEFERFEKADKTYGERVSTFDGDYTMDHTTGVLLLIRSFAFPRHSTVKTAGISLFRKSVAGFDQTSPAKSNYRGL